MSAQIYLDNNATTPTDVRVVEAMLPFFTTKFGNAASHHHSFGHEARENVENARKIIATEINASTREIVFTSGATEAINLAIKGSCQNLKKEKNHIITQATEHKAVLDTCEYLRSEGWQVTILPVDGEGKVDTSDIANAINSKTALVAIMHVNNEIGTIQPIKEIGKICRTRGIYFFVDAAQGFGKLKIDVEKFNIDMLSASAHKIYGPKGIGFLYVNQKKPRVNLQLQMEGGGHERGMRSGTLAVPLIVGLGEAVKIISEERESENKKISKLRDKLIDAVLNNYPEAILNGTKKERITNNANFCFPGIEAESLIMKMKNIACSTGSACSSANLEPSHVIKALGRSNELANTSVRFSLGRFTTEAEIDFAINEINSSVSELLKKKNRKIFQYQN